MHSKTQRGVFVNSPQGGKKIGELINGVLHMNRTYSLHHYNKMPGWAIDKATLDANINRIQAFMIHSSGRPLQNQETIDEILSFAPDNLQKTLEEVDIINFGHGAQYLIPDYLWNVETSSSQPVRPTTPVPMPTPEPLLEDYHEMPIEVDYDLNTTLFYPTPPETKLVPEPIRLFNAVAVRPLLEAGYLIGYPSLGEGFYFTLDNNVLVLRKKGTEFSTPYEFSQKEQQERSFSILR